MRSALTGYRARVREDSGYFRTKLAQERLIKSCPVPYTLIHATQFFEFVCAIAQFSTDGDTVRLPPVLFQPIAAEDIAGAIEQLHCSRS